MKSSTLKWIGIFVVASFAYAAAVPLIEWSFNSRIAPGQLLRDYVFSIAYAICIGGILSKLTPFAWAISCPWQALLRWPVRGLAVVAGNTAGCLLAGLVPLAVYGRTYAYWQSFEESFKIGLILSAVAVSFIATYEQHKGQLRATAMQLKTKELERERALKLATEARLSSLESRIHPHFLFNTINSVSSLIPEHPERAERMLTQMAGLLRFSLDSAHLGLVPLERELKIVEDYLEIEKARFGDRLRYAIQVPPDLYSASVPPLAIETLVENSVKYAVSSRRQGALIRVSAEALGESLLLQVHDDGPGFADLQFPSGHGLGNLQERLAALFGDKAILHAGSEQGAVVSLEVPLTGLPAGSTRIAATDRLAVHL